MEKDVRPSGKSQGRYCMLTYYWYLKLDFWTLVNFSPVQSEKAMADAQNVSQEKTTTYIWMVHKAYVTKTKIIFLYPIATKKQWLSPGLQPLVFDPA